MSIQVFVRSLTLETNIEFTNLFSYSFFHTVFSIQTVYFYSDSLSVLFHNIKKWCLNLWCFQYNIFKSMFSHFLNLCMKRLHKRCYRSSFLRLFYAKDVLKVKTPLLEYLFNKVEGIWILYFKKYSSKSFLVLIFENF